MGYEVFLYTLLLLKKNKIHMVYHLCCIFLLPIHVFADPNLNLTKNDKAHLAAKFTFRVRGYGGSSYWLIMVLVLYSSLVSHYHKNDLERR